MMIQARKRFGQNFLHDRQIIHKIIAAIRPEIRSHIVEIGPGQGALTYPLLAKAPRLTALEIDRDLIALLAPKASCTFQLVETDALKFDFSSLRSGSLSEPSLTIVGNLPYNISTPLLFHLMRYHRLIDEMFFMLQKEVVLRMAARPKTKDFGRLSVMIQYFCEVEPLFSVPPAAFTPEPQVDSMIVRLKPYSVSPFGQLKDFALFEKIVMLAFGQRRKTLKNPLKPLQLNIPQQLATCRAEELSVQEWVDLANVNCP